MSKKAKVTSTIKFSSELKWVSETKKGKPWYARGLASIVALLILATIDLAGFIQGAFNFDAFNINGLQTEKVSDEIIRIFGIVVMVLGFLVAFEVATIYMAYAFSLKLYNYDRQAIKRIKSSEDRPRISKYISTSMLGWISFGAFLLGVILNAIFRIGTIDSNVYFFKENTYLISSDWALTIVMIFLPIITSIMNFVIGCFTFDPILFELNQIAKRISILLGRVEEFEIEEKNTNEKINNIQILKRRALDKCDGAIMSATALRTTLRTRVYEDEMRKVK